MSTHSKIIGNVDWSIEAPNRPFLGNGHTVAEGMIVHFFSISLTTFVALYWWLTAADPTLIEIAFIVILAYDLLGGVVANSLNSCKRFYHVDKIPASSVMTNAMRNPLIFTAFHVHPIVFAIVLGYPLLTGFAWYVGLWISVAMVAWAPLYLRRPIATALCITAIILSQMVVQLPTGLEWFIPSIFLKLVLGHSVQEEPYRPAA